MSRPIYFTPGPGQLNPSISEYIHDALDIGIASISHRSQAYMDIHFATTQALRELLTVPADYHIFFGGSATEMMERILQNTAKLRTFHLVNGAFSRKFFHMAQAVGKTAIAGKVPDGEGFHQFPHEHVHPDTELICLTHCETSTGVMTGGDLIQAVRQRYPEKLLAVDIVSSSPMILLNISAVDYAFFSVQKGFGLPAGLGVAMVSQRCLDRSLELSVPGKYSGGYHSFSSWYEFGKKSQTPETPNVLAIYLLGRVCKALLSTGIASIRDEILQKAELINEVIQSHPGLSFSIREPKFRSPSMVVINTVNDSGLMISRLSEQGVIVGKGYGKQHSAQIRIANFPAHDIKSVMKLCRLISQIP